MNKNYKVDVLWTQREIVEVSAKNEGAALQQASNIISINYPKAKNISYEAEDMSEDE